MVTSGQVRCEPSRHTTRVQFAISRAGRMDSLKRPAAIRPMTPSVLFGQSVQRAAAKSLRIALTGFCEFDHLPSDNFGKTVAFFAEL